MMLEFFVGPNEGNEEIVGAIKKDTIRLSECGLRPAEDRPCRPWAFQGYGAGPRY